MMWLLRQLHRVPFHTHSFYLSYQNRYDYVSIGVCFGGTEATSYGGYDAKSSISNNIKIVVLEKSLSYVIQ